MHGLLQRNFWEQREWGLPQLCRWLCPTLDIDLFAEENGSHEQVIRANDLVDLDAEQLLRRVAGGGLGQFGGSGQVSSSDAASHLRLLKANVES